MLRLVMRPAPWLKLSVALTCGLLSACSSNKGPATNAYLRAYVQVSADLATQLRQLSPVTIPARPFLPPHPTPEERRAFATRRRDYPNALNQYYNAFIERGHVLENLYGQALKQMAALDGAGVDLSAVEMVAIRERTIGQRRELFVELGQFAALARQRQEDDSLNSLVTDLLGGALKGAVSNVENPELGGFVGAAKGFASFAAKGQADLEGIREQSTRVATACSPLQRDVIEFQTALAQLLTNVQAKYPDQDWSFMVPKQTVAAP